MARACRKPDRRKRRGQAMIEYSIVNALIVLALTIGVSLRVIPSPFPNSGGRMNVLEVILWAYHTYYDGFYLVLSSPYP
jgi:uncharacterized protein (UPF0333 family)